MGPLVVRVGELPLWAKGNHHSTGKAAHVPKPIHQGLKDRYMNACMHTSIYMYVYTHIRVCFLNYLIRVAVWGDSAREMSETCTQAAC